ncbi:MAG: hypothetical protein EOO86_11090 [Pedobacter sp.]|nr:MAG: hypothetical protein EOO86_11090 [Pedobacter sp.]
MRKLIRPILFVLACLVYAGCSSTKSLKPGQILYTGADIIINPDSSGKIDDEKQVKADLKTKTRPRPNNKLKLAIYNFAGEPKKPKGLRNWIRKKGEPPVLLSEVKLKYNNDVLTSYLLSEGYLQATVTGDTVVKDKKGKAIYTAVTGDRYKINQITFPPDSGVLTKIINANKDKSLLKVGDYYDLDVYKNERIRIDNDLKENGYFYFSPDYLIMQVDSTIGKNLVNITVKVKDIAPDAGLKPYTIKNVNIYPNYSLRRDSTLRRLKPLQYHDFNIYDDRNTFKPRLFDRLVFFQKGEVYNRRDHNQSLNRMVNVGAFQDVRAEFLPLDSFKNNQLDLNIYLTPLKKNSLTFSVTGTSKSNNFVGSEVKVTQTTRNLFRGAEQLDVSVSGGFETQTRGTSLGRNSLSLTTEAKLTFPRFIVPFYKPNSTTAFIPKTIASLSYQMLNRGSEYTLHAFKGEFGYNFKENQYKEHNFNTWANRLNVGYGFAYGNSTSLPFVRQFFAGGSNDIRAFPARTLGPGTYKVPDDAIFADQGGDIKLMLNSELRFKIVSILYGALFVDAGNVWLRKEDTGIPGTTNNGRPGSEFKLKNALSELAVGTGAGVRVDASIFVVRLDVAFPVRKPYLAEGQRWVFDDIAFGNKDWRRQNLIFNIGIGYPF